MHFRSDRFARMPLRLLLLLSIDFARADEFSLQIGTRCVQEDFTQGFGAGLLGMYPCGLQEENEKFFWEHSSAHGDAGLPWNVGQKGIGGEGLCMTAPDGGLEQTYPDNLDACDPEQGIVLRPCVHSNELQQWKYRDDDQRTFYLAKYPKKCMDYNTECRRLILWDCHSEWNQKFILASQAQIGSAHGFPWILPVAVGFVVCGVLLAYHWKGRKASNRVMELRNGILQYRQEGDWI